MVLHKEFSLKYFIVTFILFGLLAFLVHYHSHFFFDVIQKDLPIYSSCSYNVRVGWTEIET